MANVDPCFQDSVFHSDDDVHHGQISRHEAHRLKVQNLKMKKKFQSKRELKLGVKGNKLQTHFREQVIF